ncbi:MAG: 4-hydroxy-tetrahydrodipicolinate synthase [Phycisphaerae bacterium]
MFSGTFTALITPFKNDRVDEAAFARQIKAQVDAGVTGIVPVGTTGESPTLSHEEHRRVIEAAVKLARGTGVKVIAGTGSNSTTEAIELTAHAKASGADAALLVNPYYNKPTQEGLVRHFTAIARQVDIPIVLYNIPGRTNVTMTVSTMKRLVSECKNIVAVKDAAGNLDLTSEAVGAGLTVLSGDDSLTLPMMAVGAKGVVSVASNIVPEMVVSMVKLAAAGDFSGARTIHHKLFALCRALFIETNPIPIKAAMQMMGRDSGELRLPLCEIAESNRAVVKAALLAAGLSPA